MLAQQRHVTRRMSRRTRSFASLLITFTLITACSESGVVQPGTELPPGPAALTPGAVDASTARVATGPLTNGGNQAGTISAAGQVDTWTMNVTAGQLIVVAVGETSGVPTFTPWIRLLDPSSTVVGNAWNVAAAQIQYRATTTGSYTVLVASNDGPHTATGSYTLLAAALQGPITVSGGDEGGAMTIGQNHTGNIGVGDLDFWTISANTGDAILLDVGEVSGSVDFTPWIRLVAPDGSLIGNAWNVAAVQLQINATQSGTYTVIVGTNDAGLDATGSYRLVLAQTPGTPAVPGGDEGGPITVGSNYPGSLPVGDLDQYTFSANTGDYIMLAVGEVSGAADFTPWIRLIAPNGQIVGNNWNVAAAQIAFSATQTGTYSVVVSTNDAGNDATGNYVLTLAKGPGTVVISPGDEGGAMTDGANHTGHISVGDIDEWQFTANSGDAILLALGETSGTSTFTPWIRLVAPNGQLIGNAWNVAAAQLQVNATQTGTYSVVVGTNDAGFDETGDYVLTSVVAPGTLTVSPGDEGGAATNGGNDVGTVTVGDLDAWTFTAPAGIPMAISVGKLGGTDFTPWIRLISPTGAVIGNNWNTNVGQINVVGPVTGTYTVVVSTNDAGNDGTGTYQLVVQKSGNPPVPPGDQGGPMTIGDNHTGAITVGDLDRWTFQATANEYVALNIGKTSGTNFTPWIRAVSSTGSILVNGWNTNVAVGGFVAPTTGLYTVAIGSNNAGRDGTGNYTLILAKNGTSVTPPGDNGGTISNGAHSGTITTGDLDIWDVNVTNGNQFSIVAGRTSGVDLTPWIRVISPTGALVGNMWGSPTATLNLTATATGKYRIIIGTNDAGNDATGDYSLTISGVN